MDIYNFLKPKEIVYHEKERYHKELQARLTFLKDRLKKAIEDDELDEIYYCSITILAIEIDIKETEEILDKIKNMSTEQYLNHIKHMLITDSKPIFSKN